MISRSLRSGSGLLTAATQAILSELAVFIVGKTVCALTSESSVLDVAALMNPTFHATARYQTRRLRATREVSKARGSPRRLPGRRARIRNHGWHFATAALPCLCCPNGFL